MDNGLLEQIYRKYAGEIRLYLYSLCGSMVWAEDLMHDVFVKALLSLPEEHENFRAWLYRVAHNLCVNEMKKSSRAGKAMEAVYFAGKTDRASSESDVTHTLLKEERDKCLCKCMRRLPQLQMEVLFMFYFGGLSAGNIAGVLNIKQENVRVILHRGRRKLREMMEKEGYNEF